MKIQFIFALVGVLSLNVYAKEQLHAYPSSGLQLHATENVKKVEAAGPNVRFFLEQKEILATAFVYKDTKNPYPLLNDFAEQFLNRAYANYEFKIFEKDQIEINFLNKKNIALEYLIEIDGTKCELYLASATGNQTYIFFNISNELTTYKCEIQSEKLKLITKQITESITINDI